MKNILLFLTALSLISGCASLEQQPLPSITPSNFFSNADDAEAALASAYDGMQGGGYYSWELNAGLGEMPSDNCTSVNGDVAYLDNMTWTPFSYVVDAFYRQAYVSINRANAVIRYVPTIQMPEARRNQIVGEAKFLRAMHYFHLVRVYGGVPLRLEPVESGDPASVQLARSTAEQVYVQINADLTEAEKLTNSSYGDRVANRTRVIKTAVNALQARVALTTRQWPAVLTATTKVLGSGLYSLNPDFNALFPANNDAESIFEVQFSGNQDGGNALPDLVLPAPPATYSFPKFNIPTTELVTQYADTTRDRRWKFTGVMVPGGRHQGSVVNGGPGTTNDNGFFIYKWRSNPNAFNSPDNTYILRLADVMLMHAEASNEQNGPNADALTKLNAIRTRAGLLALILTDLTTKQAFRNEVDRQRRLELAFEGERWFDLVRYARHAQADPAAPHAITALDIIQEKRKTRDVNYLLYPIPQSEINNNGLVTQNPGY